MGLLKALGIASLILALTLAFSAGVLIYLAKDLIDISIEDFQVTGITTSSEEIFIGGYFSVNNPSRLSIPIKSISNKIILKGSNQIISSGEIPSFTLKKESTTEIPFSQKIEWIPNLEEAQELILQERIYIKIKMAITLNLPIIRIYPISLEQEIDAKEYLEDYLKKIFSQLDI